MEKLFEQLEREFAYPQPITFVVLETLKELIAVDYFLEYFQNDQKAVRFFYDKLCSSLIQKFLNNEELMWCDQSFSKIMNEAGVDYSVQILEELNLIYVFDCNEENKKDKVLVMLK